MRRIKVSFEEKLNAIKGYLNGTSSTEQISAALEVSRYMVLQWVNKYKAQGEAGLQILVKNTYYPIEMKIQAVNEYLDGKASQYEICRKYQISCHSLLCKWIKRYTGHEEMKSQNSTGGKIMTNGRKTTYEERVEIVSFCIANNENYQLTSENYQVSYQQVYTWVKKYQQGGPEALADKRGKRKNPDDMTETEKLVAQVKLLEAENKRLQMENGFLKKLKEVERRRSGNTNIQLLKNTPRKPGSR